VAEASLVEAALVLMRFWRPWWLISLHPRRPSCANFSVECLVEILNNAVRWSSL
jgi:hypothetical protein